MPLPRQCRTHPREAPLGKHVTCEHPSHTECCPRGPLHPVYSHITEINGAERVRGAEAGDLTVLWTACWCPPASPIGLPQIHAEKHAVCVCSFLRLWLCRTTQESKPKDVQIRSRVVRFVCGRVAKEPPGACQEGVEGTRSPWRCCQVSVFVNLGDNIRFFLTNEQINRIQSLPESRSSHQWRWVCG